jgi:hypothetical protein
MSIVSVALAGQHGISVDIAPAELPANAWSFGYNARFSHGAVKAMQGDLKLLETEEQFTYALLTNIGAKYSAEWLLCADNNFYALEQHTLTDVTPASMPAGGPQPGELAWSGGVLGQVSVANDGTRAPWAWLTPDPAEKLIPLANWPTTDTCYTLRSFKQYLVALGITRTGAGAGNFTTMVKWSHPADPGTVPSSWDAADPTKDAGETVLSETPGQCVDCVSLRDTNIVYKTDSVWGMQYVGGVFVFRFYKIFGDWGIPTRNCAVEYVSGKHFCFTGTDLVIHDGNSAKSVVTGRYKSLLKLLSDTQLSSCFVCTNPAFDEVWFCFRQQEDEKQAVDTAIVYNYLEETLTLRALPDYRFIGTGRLTTQPRNTDTWDTAPGIWDNEGMVWGEVTQIPAFQRLLGLGEELLAWTDGGSIIHGPFILERTYIGIPTRTDKAPDLSSVKFVRRVWPRFTGDPGTKLLVTFGVADSVGEDIKWKTPFEFVIGTTRKFDITLSGKVMAIRIESDTPVEANLVRATLPGKPETVYPSPVYGLVPTTIWRFNGIDIDVKAAGEM